MYMRLEIRVTEYRCVIRWIRNIEMLLEENSRKMYDTSSGFEVPTFV